MKTDTTWEMWIVKYQIYRIEYIRKIGEKKTSEWQVGVQNSQKHFKEIVNQK